MNRHDAEPVAVGAMILAPPSPDVCQTCAVAHDPEEPHNRDSMYYQIVFKEARGAWPTWADAMAHCSPEMIQLWTGLLTNAGATIGAVTP